MVQTSVAKPSFFLHDYVRGFELREIDTGGQVMFKPIHAFHESLIAIFITGKSCSTNTVSMHTNDGIDSWTSRNFSGIMGVHSSMKGAIAFSGYYKVFNIQFRPTGFTSIFKIPAQDIIDKMYDSELVFRNGFKQLHEQLDACENLIDMVCFAEKFLLKNLIANKTKNAGTDFLKASNLLFDQPGAYSIEQLAYHTNMSLKTFERRFIKEVGLPPKHFLRIQRFNKAVDLKVSHSELSWTRICYQLGYYDQNHFIKDFTAFAGLPPSAFFKSTPPPMEKFSII